VAARFAAVSGESSDAPKDVYGWYHLALRLDDDPGILFQLGVQKVRLGVADFGVEDMRSALALRQDANGFRGLGQVLLGRLQRPQEALDAFEKALELAPGDAEARSGVAQSWLLLGEDEKAKTELDALLAAAPETPGLHGALAQYWVRKEDKEKAIEALRTEVRLHPSVPSVLWLAEMEKQAGRLEAAADLLDRSYREMGVPDLALAKIVITAEQGKDKEALVDLDALLKAHPQEQKLWLAKGHLAQRSGALEQAEQAFMEASRLAPDRPLLLVPLVVTRYRIEHSGGKGQLSALDTARLLLKADSDLLIAAASELASVGQASHARQILELAVAESPSRIRPAAALFGLLTRQGETAEASRLKEQILGSLSPEERPLFLQLVEPMTQQ
jgi:tetratricopeptide (TPR) repeat protein